MFLLLFLGILIPASLLAQPMFQKFTGVGFGKPEIKGAFQFDNQKQEFTLQTGGCSTESDGDVCYFVSQEVEGDFIFSANMKFLEESSDSRKKMGLMIRNSRKKDAVYMGGLVFDDGLTSLQYRTNVGGETSDIASEIKLPDFLQLERKGNEFIFRYSKGGEPLAETGRIKLDMDSTVFAGMIISSAKEDVVMKARFWNVRLDKPATEGTDGYQSPSSGRLEVLNIETGYREVIYETDAHIEAPNWSRKGKFLVYNFKGLLYKYDLKKKKQEEINTGFATSINNDHGISFDGKMIAISHDTEEKGQRQSIIYTVPLKGGMPARVTTLGPSYWHGWSPDDKWHVYCARRNGNYDVYKISAEGGEEIRLTTAEGLDDGPEYSPDGNYIYFNSERSGSMEIWRMKPDGSGQEQITNDEFQNWFAHPSPDGQWLLFISYLPDVPANSHPRNQRVMLRLMPAAGGRIKTVAFLYGGQGTINVPSWSPDSKKVAFVSYTYH